MSLFIADILYEDKEKKGISKYPVSIAPEDMRRKAKEFEKQLAEYFGVEKVTLLSILPTPKKRFYLN